MSFRIGDEVEIRIYPSRHDPRTWCGKVVELPDDIDEYDVDMDGDEEERYYGIAYVCPVVGVEYITYRIERKMNLVSLNLSELFTI